MIKKIYTHIITFILVLLSVFTVFHLQAEPLTVEAATKKAVLKITKQPTTVVVRKGAVAKATVKATGKGLKYTWYYKKRSAAKYVKSSSMTTSTYSVKMSSARNGTKVYCVIKDKYGKSVKTNVVTLSMGNTAKITKQPKSVKVSSGATAKVTVKATGDGLKYTWYYKKSGAAKYVKSSSMTTGTYSVKMSSTRNGTKVYCVIKDKYGNSVKTKAVTLLQTMDAGIYAFYNTKTKTYLSFKGNTLKLSKTAKDWELKPIGSDFYVYSYNSDVMLDVDNAYVAAGTTVKLFPLTGYKAQTWKISVNANGTYSFLSAVDNKYCLGFQGGKAVLQRRKSGSSIQEWKAVNVGAKYYRSISSKNNIIELRLPTNITEVISVARLKKWANDLETAYNSFYDLTNYKPYKNIIVEALKPSAYADAVGYVLDGSNIIYVDNNFIYEDLKKMAVRENDWNFCLLHEMGHMFDFNRPWNFETEMMTDFKLAYVLEMNGASAAPAYFDAATVFKGADIITAYDILGNDFSQNYDIFSFAQRFLQIKEDIGWMPIKNTFHYLQKYRSSFSNMTKEQQFKNFVSVLSTYSGRNIQDYFTASEWNTVLNTLNNS